MAFTYVVSTDRGKVRLKVGDTNSAAYAFEDDEIDAFLTEGGSVNEAAKLAIMSLLVSQARRERAFSLPGTTYDDKGRVAALKMALDVYGGGIPTVSVLTLGVIDSDSGFTDPYPS